MQSAVRSAKPQAFTASRCPPRAWRATGPLQRPAALQRPIATPSNDAEAAQQRAASAAATLGLLALLPALPARADELDAAAIIAAAAAEDKGATSSVNEVLVSIGFALVVGLLAVVSGGVFYLSFKQWLDKRQENEDRQREAASIRGLPQDKKDKKDDKDDDEDDFRGIVKTKVKRDKSKGFGSS